MPRKILVLTSSFPRGADDWSARFVLNLYASLPAGRFDVVVVAPHAPGAARRETIRGVRVERFRYFWPSRLERLSSGAGVLPSARASWLGRLQLAPFLLAEVVAALRAYRRERPDLVHAHWLVPQGAIAALLKLLFGCPVVVTGHGTDLFGLGHVAIVKRFAVRLADAATVNSSATLRALLALSPGAAARTRVLPMGVDAELFHPADGERSAGSAPLILCVGRLIVWKGTEFAVRAMSEVRRRYPSARLELVGLGPDAARLRRLVEELGLVGTVELVGALSQAELAERYRHSAVVVVPSVVDPGTGETEAQNVTILEALASGVPVVATRVGGIADVVDGATTGLLVDERRPDQLAASVLALLDDGELAGRIARHGREFIEERLAWPVAGLGFAEVFEAVARSARGLRGFP